MSVHDQLNYRTFDNLTLQNFYNTYMKQFNYIYSIFLIICFISFCTQQQKKNSFDEKNLFKQFNGEPVVPRYAVKISIHEFFDRTNKFAYTNKLMLKIRDYINLDGRLSVVVENPDLELTGEISTFQIQPIVFSSQGIPIKKRIFITTNIHLFDFKNKKFIFKNNIVQSFVEFSENLPPITSQIHAIDITINKLAERIQHQIIHGWFTDLMTPLEKGKR